MKQYGYLEELQDLSVACEKGKALVAALGRSNGNDNSKVENPRGGPFKQGYHKYKFESFSVMNAWLVRMD